MHRKIVFLAGTFICGLALTLALMLLLTTTTKPVFADPGELYVAPGGNCGGVSPCYENVQAAVDAATPGDTVKMAAGTYSGVSAREGMTQVVYISKTITIQGGYTTTNWTTSDPDANLTTLDAQDQGRVLLILGEISVTVKGFRITGGNADFGGGIASLGARTTLRNNQIFSNTATGSAGGLYLESQTGADIVSDNTFAYNTSGNCGGGLTLNTTASTIRNNTIIFNEANSGGGICSGGNPSTYSVNSIMGNTIASNTATTDGGGVWLRHNDDTLSGNIIASNVANRGGGLALNYWGNTTLINNIITDNQANTGSGLHVLRFNPHLLHNTIAHNSNGDGVGVYVDEDWLENSTVILTNTILVSHTVGITVTAGSTATVNGVLWHDNTPDYGGSGIITVTNEHTGSPAFASDGYHITAASDAVDAGVEAGVTMDMDGEARPFGTGPDLGADERATAGTTAEPTTASAITATVGGLTTTVQIPTGAVTESTTMTYTALATTGQGDPTGFSFANHTFDLDAYRDGSLLSGFTFSVPVTIALHYADADIAGLDEDSLVLEYWNGSAWEDAACGAYDRHPDENWLAVPICHLSQFALFGEREYLIYLPLVLRNS